MTGMQSTMGTDVSSITGLENRLASALVRTAGDVARMETLDEEQRAEIYAILQAIRTDTEVHRAAAASLEGNVAPKSDA